MAGDIGRRFEQFFSSREFGSAGKAMLKAVGSTRVLEKEPIGEASEVPYDVHVVAIWFADNIFLKVAICFFSSVMICSSWPTASGSSMKAFRIS